MKTCVILLLIIGLHVNCFGSGATNCSWQFRHKGVEWMAIAMVNEQGSPNESVGPIVLTQVAHLESAPTIGYMPSQSGKSGSHSPSSWFIVKEDRRFRPAENRVWVHRAGRDISETRVQCTGVFDRESLQSRIIELIDSSASSQ